MISGDTGPVHIAGAVGTPIVALFGPTRAERNGPWSPADISISRYDQCVCHYERRCRRGQPCIDDISIDQVIAAIERRVAAR
jgi:ADP-heptose:LPS heptosyltransferase